MHKSFLATATKITAKIASNFTQMSQKITATYLWQITFWYNITIEPSYKE